METTSPPTLTVVMPAYNEELAIEASVDDVRRHVLDVVPGSGLLVVNDGSKDHTGEKLDKLAAADGRVAVLHKPNGGHGSAIIAGMNAADRDFIMLVDSDLQIPMSAFPELWRAVNEGSDAAFGVRRRRYDPRLRLWLTAVIRWFVRVTFGVWLYDANVPFKVFRRSHWMAAKPLIPPDTLAPSLFLAVWMKRRGLQVAQVDVPHKERELGEVSIRRWKLLKFCWRACKQLIRFRWRLAHARD